MAWLLNAAASGLRRPGSLLADHFGLLGRYCQPWTHADAQPLASTSGSSFQHPQRRACSSSTTATGDGSMPRPLADELRKLETQLYTSSRIDGRKRGTFSTDILGAKVPVHAIEPGLPVITAHARVGTGKNVTKWLRKTGRMPARVFSMPGQINVHLDAADGAKLVRQFGRNGCQSRVLQLNIVHPDDENKILAKLRVKPHEVMIRSNTAMLEAITFLYCPMDRIVEVNVPIKLINDDAAPGVKKGGWMAIERRLIPYRCLGSSIPPFIEVDVRLMELEDVIRLRDLPIPAGTKLHTKNYDLPVLRCTTDIGKD